MRPSGATVTHAFVRHELAQLLAQRAQPSVAPYCSTGPGLFCPKRRRRLADAVRVKQRRVGKAAGKADDAGLAQQFEEFADGGGFYVFQAVGKLHGVGSLS